MPSKTWKEITVTRHLIVRNKNIPKDAKGVHCSKCSKFIPIGQKIIRHRHCGNIGSKTKYYCKSCYEKLWI